MSKHEISWGLNIPLDQWQQTGPEDDPSARLLKSFTINGCSMHLEAVAVTEGEARTLLDVEAPEQEYHDSVPSWIQEAIAASADYEPVETIKMDGRSYILIATPYQA